MDGRGLEREYGKRRGVPKEFVILAISGLLVSGSALDNARFNGADSWTVAAPVLWGVVIGRVCLDLWRARTWVSAEGVTVRGPVRTRFWAWSDIYDLRVEYRRGGGSSGAAQWPSYLYDRDGRRVLLPHLDERQHGDPLAEVAGLRATAAAQGLAVWEPRPETEQRIARAERRRTARTRAFTATAVLVLAMVVLDIWLILSDRPHNALLLFLGVPAGFLLVSFLVLDRLGEAMTRRSVG